MTDISLDIEAAVIGGLLLHPEECSQALDQLSPEDFSIPYAADIFTLIARASKEGKQVDGALIASGLKEPEAERYAVLAMQSFISMASYPAYIEAIKGAARKRRTLRTLQELICSDPDPNDILPELEQIIEAEQDTGKPFEDEMAKRLLKYNERIYQPLDQSERIHTGFGRLDGVLNGLRKGSLSYIGAAPSTGKTTFALNILFRALKDQRRVLFFSLEMSVEQLLDRLFANALSISYELIDHRRLDKNGQHRITAAVSRLYEQKHIWIVDNDYTLESMASKIAQFKPELVFVDFLQNVRTRERFNNRKAQIDYISAEFKRLARVRDCHICVLSQINRVGEQGAPRMSDLKESGNLEADGDVIMLMHRPFVQNKASGHEPSETTVLLDKNKFGRVGLLSLRFDGVFQRFTEMDKRHEG